MANINSYLENWKGHTGQEVLDWINQKLQNSENAITEFDEPIIEGSSITIKGKNSAGDVVSSITFDTVAQASATIHFSLIGDDNIIIGKDTEKINIPYVYHLTDENSFITGATVKIIYSINGKLKEFEGIKSRAQEDAQGILTIPSSEFKVGNNTLYVSAYSNIGVNERTTTTAPSPVSVTILDLKLSVEVSPANVSELTQEFTITPIVKNAGVQYNNNITYKYKFGANQGQIFNPNNNVFTMNSFKSGTQEEIANIKIQKLPLYFVATYNDGEIYSNICKVEIIDTTENTESINIDNIAQEVSKFNNSQSFNDYINTVQYTTELFTFNVNRLNSTEVDAIVSHNGVEDVVKTQTIDGLGQISFQYTFRDTGSYIVRVGESQVNVIVSELNVALKEPVDYVYSVDVNNQDWDGVKENIDGVGNGWINGVFKLNNGATFTANCTPYSKGTAYTISLKYKVENIINESEVLISCINSNKTMGFEITPNKIKLVNGTSIEQIIDNSEVHEVTLVYYDNNCGIYSNTQVIYVDGLYQCIQEVGSIIKHDYKIQCTATDSTLCMYGIKVFEKALSFVEVQALYAFNSGINIAEYINKNNIFTTNSTRIGNLELDINKVPNGSIVLVLSAPENSNGQTPWYIINSLAKSEENKKYKIPLSSMRLYVQGDDTNKRNFLAIGGCISAQGTSSMAYPIKNYRIYWNKLSDSDETKGLVTAMYFEKAHDWYPQDPEEETENATKGYQLFKQEYGDNVTKDSAYSNRFCLKADFAESSGVHNTGFARLSEYLYDTVDAKILTPITGANESKGIPPQKSTNYNYEVRENVDGQPIYLFFYNETEDEYQYAGRYNMNNDKSNVKVFGFEGIGDYSESIKDLKSTLETKAIGIDNNFVENHSTYKNGALVENSFNPTECWEFSSNDGINKQIGGFSYADVDTTFNLTSGQDPVVGNTAGRVWLNGTWEYRYPDYDEGSIADTNYRTGISKPYYLYQVYNFLYEHNQSIPSKSGINSLNEFAERLHLYFNVNNVLKYFVLTHWLVCHDQRIKNCMIAFYADLDVTQEEADLSPLYKMRGYWLFYDNDTILGLNNAGEIDIPWDFYETDTTNGFPGVSNHGLWYNLQKCYEIYEAGTNYNSAAWKLGSLIPQIYLELRKSTQNGEISRYLSTDYPEAIHNLDLEIKYLDPSDLTSLVERNLAKAQGYRNIHRNLWLTKRTNWLDNIYKFNVESNALTYKVADTSSNNSGTVSISKSDQYRFWKFYSDNEGGKNSVTLNSNVASILPIPTGLTTSSYCRVMGLNGAKTIDFSNYLFGKMSQDIHAYGKFPYLKELTIRKYNGTEVQVSPTHFSGWLDSNVMPNLEELYLCSLTSASGLNNLNVSEFNKLKILDTRGSNFGEVILPETSTLTNLYLESPTHVRLVNKPNLNLNITSGANLETIYVSNASTSVYTTIFNLVRADMESVEIRFGTSDTDRYEITEAELNALIDLPANAQISGFVYYPNEYIYKGELDNKYPNLNISDTLSSDGAVLSFNGALEEGGSLKVTSNVKVVNWSYSIDGKSENNLNGLITESHTNYSITFNAATVNNNTGFIKSLVVYGTLENGDPIQSDVINIKYIPISYITLTPENNGFTQNAEAGTIITTVSINNDSTKSHLLNDTNSSLITATFDGLNLTITYDNHILKNIQCAVSKDSVLTVNIFGVTASVNLYTNILLIDTTTNPNSEYNWLINFMERVGGTTLYASKASSYNIDSYWDWIISQLVSDVNNIQVQDFEYLKYFNSQSSTFIIPGNVPFTNLSTPRNVTSIQWTQAGYTSYETITLNKSVSKAYVSLTFENLLPPKLVFDLSQTSITKILNNGNNITEDGVFNASITYNGNSLNNPTSNNSLFIYPATLKQIGNNVDVTNPFNAIFNWFLTNVSRIYINDSSRRSAPLYTLGILPESIETVGLIASYNLSSTPFTRMGAVKTIYGLFAYNNTGIPSVSLNTVKNIGRYSFYNANNAPGTIPCSFGTVETIESNAFRYISSSAAITGDFTNVTSIGTRAFEGILYNLSITFGDKLNSLAASAFMNYDSNITYTISFGNKENAFPEPLQDFVNTGLDGRYVLQAKANSALYTLLVNKFNGISTVTIEPI